MRSKGGGSQHLSETLATARRTLDPARELKQNVPEYMQELGIVAR